MKLLWIILIVMLVIATGAFVAALNASGKVPKLGSAKIPKMRLRLILGIALIIIFVWWAWPALFQLGWTGKVKADAGRDATAEWAKNIREPKKNPPPPSTQQPLRPSAAGNWEDEPYREFNITLTGNEESQEYRIKADWGERRVPTWRIHSGAVDVSFNRKAGGTDTSGRFLTPPDKASNGTEFIQFRAREGGAHLTLYVWREK